MMKLKVFFWMIAVNLFSHNVELKRTENILEEEESGIQSSVLPLGYANPPQVQSVTPQKVDGSYEFAYHVNDGQASSQFRQEKKTSDGTVTGSYGYVDANGVQRVVDYIADHNGYRANVRNIQTNKVPSILPNQQFVPPKPNIPLPNHNLQQPVANFPPPLLQQNLQNPVSSFLSPLPQQNPRTSVSNFPPPPPKQNTPLPVLRTLTNNYGNIQTLGPVQNNPQSSILGGTGSFRPLQNFGPVQTNYQTNPSALGIPNQRFANNGLVQNDRFNRINGLKGLNQVPNQYNNLGNKNPALALGSGYGNVNLNNVQLHGFNSAGPNTLGVKSNVPPVNRRLDNPVNRIGSGYGQQPASTDWPFKSGTSQSSLSGVKSKSIDWTPSNNLQGLNNEFPQGNLDKSGNYPRRPKNNIQETIAGTNTQPEVFENSVFQQPLTLTAGLDIIPDGDFGKRLSNTTPKKPKTQNGNFDYSNGDGYSIDEEANGVKKRTGIRRIGIESLNLGDPNYSG